MDEAAGADDCLRSWRDLLDPARLRGIDARRGAALLEALRYGNPADVAVVVVAPEAPSPAPGTFSAEVAGALGDLRPWAVQGVLMLGAAGGAAAPEWTQFLADFLRRFCAARAEAPVHLLLWGPAARALAPGDARALGHAVLEWPGAPAPGAPELGSSFRSCPHFDGINAARAAAGRRPICWNPLESCIAFTDGSCPRNGKPGARASFAALVAGAQFGDTTIRGEVRPAGYALVDEDAPERGMRAAGPPVAPSNNRGELLGIIFALAALLRGRALGRVEIVSDSEICLKTLLVWLPARLAKGTERELKNFDLVWIAWRLLERLRRRAAAVTLTHTRSHQRPPPRAAPERAHLLHRGNAMADEHAALALALALARGPAEPAIEVLDAPAVLRSLRHFDAAPPRVI